MNIEEYFKNLTNELSSLKDRVRHYIDDAHWLSDGEWKESVLRAILRRHLPKNIGIGRGFIVDTERASKQIDVLLYDYSKPILFQDGDFVIITSDSVLGIIEVKTKIRQKNDLQVALQKLAENCKMIKASIHHNERRFSGLFSYEQPDFNPQNVLQILQSVVNWEREKVINCISLGKNFFIRYWPFAPGSPGIENYSKWHLYNLQNKAPAYFIHNVIDHLCPQWATENVNVWYPEDGKENHKIADISFDIDYLEGL